MLTLEFIENTIRTNVACHMVDTLLRRRLLQNHLIVNLEVLKSTLVWRNTLLREVKRYIDNNLYPAQANVMDPTKDNFTQPQSIKEILDELKISKDDYYRVLSKLKEEDLQLYLKKQAKSCFVNNCFDVGLKTWQANMDIQPVLMSIKQ